MCTNILSGQRTVVWFKLRGPSIKSAGRTPGEGISGEDGGGRDRGICGNGSRCHDSGATSVRYSIGDENGDDERVEVCVSGDTERDQGEDEGREGVDGEGNDDSGIGGDKDMEGRQPSKSSQASYSPSSMDAKDHLKLSGYDDRGRAKSNNAENDIVVEE